MIKPDDLSLFHFAEDAESVWTCLTDEKLGTHRRFDKAVAVWR